MRVITLLSDFGLQDEYVGVMKGTIASIAPGIAVIDLTHQIPAQNILAGALVLGRASGYFPPGTIHLGVVDPGVGTSRRPMAAHLGDHFFVGPDNGLFSVLYRRAEASGENINLVHLDREKYWLPRVSGSFHGRDIFAPVAAHMAAGIPLSELGSSLSDPVIIDLEEPQKIAGGWMGKVTWIDTFGNLATNVPAELIKTNPFINTTILGRTVQGLVRTFGECAEGELAALINSSGYLEIAEVNGSAARRLGAIIGDDVEILTGGSQSGG